MAAETGNILCLWEHDRQRLNFNRFSNLGFFNHDKLETVTTAETENGNMTTKIGSIAMSGCSSLSQSPNNTFFKYSMVENNPRFAVSVSNLAVTLTVLYTVIIAGFGSHIAISVYRSLQYSIGADFYK